MRNGRFGPVLQMNLIERAVEREFPCLIMIALCNVSIIFSGDSRNKSNSLLPGQVFDQQVVGPVLVKHGRILCQSVKGPILNAEQENCIRFLREMLVPGEFEQVAERKPRDP